MSDRLDLYRAVLSHPDDDAPRLAYADWLDENGETEQAEFIRLSCRLDRIPEGTARWRPLRERADDILRAHRAGWSAAVQELVLSAEFRRGFVDAVRLSGEAFLQHADRILEIAPVRLWQFQPASFFNISGPTLRALADAPALAQVRGVAVGYFNADELLRLLARSRHLSNLTTLSISGRLPSAGAVMALAEASPKLCEVDAANSAVTIVRDLWRRNSPARLTRLSLADCHVSDYAVEQLARSPAVADLQVLRLDGNDLSSRSAEALADSEYLGKLRELSLADVRISDLGARALAGSPIFAELRTLNLRDCHIDNAGAQALADSPHLGNLECLCLDGNRVSIEIERELAKRFGPDVCSFSW